jgi:hypothetical protein
MHVTILDVGEEGDSISVEFALRYDPTDPRPFHTDQLLVGPWPPAYRRRVESKGRVRIGGQWVRPRAMGADGEWSEHPDLSAAEMESYTPADDELEAELLDIIHAHADRLHELGPVPADGRRKNQAVEPPRKPAAKRLRARMRGKGEELTSATRARRLAQAQEAPRI